MLMIRPITEKNIGHKMLSKMGWKEGEGLGKNRGDAILEPVSAAFLVVYRVPVDSENCIAFEVFYVS